MKIKFQGFKGFTSPNESIEINDISILTGKNGSGKSTFLKYLNLFSTYLEKINSIEDFFITEIDCKIEELGDIHRIVEKDEDIIIVVSTFLEFFKGECEWRFNLIVNENILKVSCIDLFSKDLDRLVWSFSRGTYVFPRALLAFYNYSVPLYNKCVESLAKLAHTTYKNDDKRVDYHQLYLPLAIDLMEDEQSSDYLLRHLNANEDTEHGKVLGIQDGELAFQGEEMSFRPPEAIGYFGDRFNFFVLSTIDDAKLNITKDELTSVIVEMYPDFDLKILDSNAILSSVIDGMPEFDHKILDSDSIFSLLLSYSNDIISCLQRSENGNYNFFYHEEFYRFHNNIEDEFNDDIDSYQVMEHLIDSKIPIIESLVKNSKWIFEKSINDLKSSILNISSLSSVKIRQNRYHNLYDKEDSLAHVIYNYSKLSNEDKVELSAFLLKCFSLFGICEDVVIENKENAGFIYLISDGVKVPLIDEGSGRSKLASLIISLTTQLYKNKDSLMVLDHRIERKQKFDAVRSLFKIIILEEPESNLHPDLQSKLADLLLLFTEKFRVKFIVETHSEYFIRKLQYLVAKKQAINDKDVNIYYFTLLRENNMRHIDFYKIPMDENGVLLKEFGHGFFDEADNLAIELFNTSQAQKN